MSDPARAEDGDVRRGRVVRFLIAGLVNTLFGFAVYSAAITMGTVVWLSLLLGLLSGVLFNFVTTGGYAFRDLSLKRFPRFVMSYMIVYAVNLGLLDLVSLWLPDKILAQAAVTLPVAALSYLLMTKFVFVTSSKT